MGEIKVLVVEDEGITARDIQRSLERLGYAVPALVSSGPAAVDAVAEHHPALVLMDIVLKGEMDGVQAAREIRTRFDIPIIFLTAFADEKTLQRAKVQEPFGYILKPFIETELAINIEMALYKHKMEQELRESEVRYRTIVEDMPALVCRFMPDGVLTFVNEHYCKYFERLRAELLGHNFFQFVPDQERDRVMAHYASLTPDNPVVSYEHQALAPDGTLRWQRWTDRALFDGYGRAVEFQSIGADITERVRAEEVLRESEEKFRTLAEQSPNMIFINKSGRVVYANERCEEVMGYTRAEFYSSHFDFIALIVPEHHEAVKLSFNRHVSGKDIEPYEYTLVTKTGETIEGILTTRLIDYDGERSILGIVTDITERKRADRALQKHNRDLALLNQVSQALAATLDFPQVIERLLRAAVEITESDGTSVWLWDEDRTSELVCEAILLKDNCQSLPDLRLKSGQGIAGWVALSGESVLVEDAHADSRFFPGVDDRLNFHTRSLLAVPLRVRDAVAGVLEVVNKQHGDFNSDDLALVEMLAASAAIAIDNSRLVGALRHYAIELEARNQDLDAFAHTVAHDLKNPLARIVGFAEVLEGSYDSLADEQIRHILNRIAQNGRKMNNIIDELLLLASVRQIEDIETGPLDMASIVADAQERLADVIKDQDVGITVPEAWPTAMGHGPWVEEIWVNYLSNAIRYGGQPPLVELGATAQPDGTVRFWIRDNGQGLTPEEQARLFTSFEQIDRVRAKGHGLGLSIVHRIVQKLGGTVSVESQVGLGSVFAFTLPSET